METNHTKGKWECIGNSDNSYSIFGDKEDSQKTAELVATVHGNDVYKNLANAKLVAAVPELLEALRDVIVMASKGLLMKQEVSKIELDKIQATFERAYSAIEKATK